MDIKDALGEFKVIFHIPFPQGNTITVFGQKLGGIDINETILISWVVMAILIGASLLLTRNLKKTPKGPQAILEAGIGFLNDFCKGYFGRRAGAYAPFIGTIFLFLLIANLIPFISPVAISLFGIEPPFTVKPPARDINFTAAVSMITIGIVLVAGLRARGLGGWCKNLAEPVPMMLPFNLLEYIIRPLSLCLRLFGNILGAYVIMLLVEGALPIPIGVPPFLSLYFDFFDGFIQALVFTFLSTIFISEAVELE
jgi:F-type H+-transporting ATPase subunit a